ncbi:MMPL family transporter [Thermomonospora cellulosilytica]|uniref:RND superfamily putative drug exporter n=1 Tax=Thermomonospora cellulosilytica TaxID=1411118 RepID=A0A7W3N0C7_9ACTN|nr:MMPL family transporter [Thermomonospora cellulosilytica]MBA9005217.1 RND superfamily putative drug exporter [Thermomonospora cellulosilytica]
MSTSTVRRDAVRSSTVPAGRLASIARALAGRHRVALLLTALFAILAAVTGGGLEKHLSAGGYTADSFESVRADRMLAERFRAGSPNLILVVRADGDIAAGPAAAAGRALVRRAAGSPGVVYVRSYWTTGDASLRAADGRTGLVLIKLAGDEDTVNRTSHALVPRLVEGNGPLQVRATGPAPVNEEVERQSAEDLTRAELLAAPLTLLILLIAFGSLVAAGLPVLVGVVSVAGTLVVLRLLTEVVPVSIFALNIATALGFGLAVDYSLFIVTRYREELGRGREVVEAVVVSLRTAGRTVVFSALTVMLSFAALLVFPIYFLRSLAYAGIAVVGMSAAASVLVMPPLLALIGRRIDRFDPLARLRRRRSGGGGGWQGLALWVMRRPVAVGASVAVLLIVLALPFTQARFGLMDDRVLPRDNPAQTAADVVRHEFTGAGTAPVVIALPGLDPARRAADLADYARRLSTLPGTERVDSAVGSFADGRQVAPPSGAFHAQGSTWLSVLSDTAPSSPAAERRVRAVRALDAPVPALVGGDAATLVDTKRMLADRLPWALAIIVVSMLVLLFLFSGSVVVPVKQLVANLLSLTASFGAMVYVFQDGHLKWLVGDFVHTGWLELTVPILMFCVAFGLAMDYSVFLLSRIREEYLATGDNTRAVAFGVERTGRLITAAALIVATVLGAMATSQLSILKLLGAGLALAVLVDATLVRGLLVPATMRLLGHANWWAPGPLRRLHARMGLKEE